MSDTYELSRSMQDQSMDHETPYSRKQWNYISDQNQGQYTNGAQTLVQFDGSSIYNAGNFIDGGDLYLAIPVVRVAAYSTNNTGTLVAPTADATGTSVPAGAGNYANEFLTTLKAGSWNLVQSLEVVVNGKTVIQQTPNVNFYNNFKLISQMSESDIKTIGSTLGISSIDDVSGYKFFGSGTTTTMAGNGLANNNIFPVIPNTALSNGTYANASQLPFISPAGTLNYNTGLMARSLPSAYGIGNGVASATNQNIYGTVGTLSLFTQNQVNAEFKNNYAGILATNYMVWYDTAIIRLKDICDYLAKLPLVKNLDMLLRIYINTGVCGVNQEAHGANSGMLYMSGSNTTFTNTCPFTINNIANLGPATVPTTSLYTVAGLFIQKAVTTSMLGVNLGLSGAAHPMSSCRLYFPMISIKPDIATSYITNNRAKRMLYRNVLYQNIANVTTGGLYSQLVQSGVT